VALGTSAKSHVEVMRSNTPWALISLVVAGVAALLAYRRRSPAAVVLPIAIFLAAQPLFFSGSLVASLGAGIAIFMGGAFAAVSFSPWRPLFAVAIGLGLGLAVLWVASILALPATFEAADAVRAPAAIGFSAIGFVAITDRRRVSEFITDRSGPAFVDLASLGLALAVIAAGAIGIIPMVPAILITAVGAVAYPASRRALVTAFEELVTSQSRRDASIRAVEDERGRLAREIHDTPLQELSGVIRRLETVPGAEGEADALRIVAGQLRDVATTLHPPVLQDLGLAAALEDLRDQVSSTRPEWDIKVEVDDLTTAGRPPAEVELAAFRITQEAVTNAMAHSGGSRLQIAGSVAPEAIELAIMDNGHGLNDEDARSAKRSGHFGLDSMRERAESVRATFTLTSRPDGVGIGFHWEAGA
jgi:signal transduction histidine kinase